MQIERPEQVRPEQFLPLKPVVFLILLAVAEAPRHGYGIMLEVRQRSDGAVDLGTSHLYRHLKRLLDDGLLRESDDAADDSDDSRRRCYGLTDLGAAVLRAESARLEALVESSRRLGFV